jgi:SAM-dependent methyltransferase
MDEFAARHASGISGVRVRRGHLPDAIPFDDGAFDLVCLFDVLEHVEDDRGAMRRVRALLKPGGYAVVTVPAYQWLYGAHDLAHQHFRRYTARDLAGKAKAAELSVHKVGYFNSLLFPLVALRRAWQRASSSQESSDALLPSPIVNRLLYSVFSIEKHIVPLVLFPFGTSVLAVLRRDA